MKKEQATYFAPAEYLMKIGTYAKDGIIVHYINGQFYAYSARCPHMPDIGCLQPGTVTAEGLKVTCSQHGWTYCIATGHNAHPGIPKYSLERFEVLVEDGSVYIKKMDDAAETVTL